MSGEINWGPEIAVEGKRPEFAEFWSKVDRRGPDECWPWTGGVTKGRGRIRGMMQLNGRGELAHRIAATVAHGSPMAGQVCMHSCDNPICVNPAHLSWGTQKQNMEDCATRRRASGMTKTHCLRGHPLSGGNLINRANGRRLCAICNAERQRRDRAAKRAIQHVA